LSQATGSFAQQVGYREREIIDFDGTVTHTGPTLETSSGGSWLRNSVNTPGYRREMRAGKRLFLPMNPFEYQNDKHWGSSSSSNLTVTRLSDKAVYTDDEWGIWVNNNTGFLFPFDSDVWSRLTSQATKTLLKRLKNSSVNVGVAVGEGRQTINLIADSARKIAKSFIALRNGNIRQAAINLGVSPKGRTEANSVRSSLAQNWLALQYGWKPLLNDVYGAAEFLAKHVNPVMRSRVTGSAFIGKTRKDVTSLSHLDLVDSQTDMYNVKYIVYFSEPLGGSPPKALGLVNPAAILWELMPYSFLVDWFLPLGSYFENLDATTGLVFDKGCLTLFGRASATRMSIGKTFESGGNRYAYRFNEKYGGSRVYCKRTKLLAFPEAEFPRFKNPLSFGHVTNALALVSEAFKGRLVK
jgi:hypothetical protein